MSKESLHEFRRPNLDEKFYIGDNFSDSDENSENGNRSDCSNSEIDISDEEFSYNYRNRAPSRNARRKSITISPRMLRPPCDDDDNNSPANSITSVNSLASLFREKIQTFPATLKRKKPKDYKLRVFVAFLFLTIIFLVSIAYILYRQKVLQRAYFERIKFNTERRIINIHNAQGLSVLEGQLGTTLNYKTVHACLPFDEWDDGSLCLEWMHRARLHMRMFHWPTDDSIRCYNVHWMSLRSGIEPTDCYGSTPNKNGHWYGGGQTAETAWPLNNARHDFAPFVTGMVEKHEWGNVLRRYFINSKGVAILVDENTPLYVSINHNDSNQFCLRAKFDYFSYVNHMTEFPHLNYTICTGTNMTQLHNVLLDNNRVEGLTEQEATMVNMLLTEPLWQITSSNKDNLTEDSIKDYIDNVEKAMEMGFLRLGHILINEFWQRHPGDFTVEVERFTNLHEIITVLHRRGFRIIFNVQPYISTESENFAEAVREGLLISERFSDRRIPALTRYKTLLSAGVLDITNPKTVDWMLRKLKEVRSEYKFYAYFLDFGSSFSMPHYYQCDRTLHNPDEYKTIFMESVQRNLTILGINSAVQRPKYPIFVTLPMFESSWDGLRRIIPTILTYGLVGYPLIVPGAVGGDYEPIWTSNFNDTLTEHNIILLDKELYMRWLQLATFLPVIKFTQLPNIYDDEKLMEMAKRLTSLRQQTVTPLLRQFLNRALDQPGTPLVRPLWMLDNNDPACHTVADEFTIGDELLVAPILYQGITEREIYLPAGVWKDGLNGDMRKGSRWVHDYRAEVDQVPFFIKMPDNTRF